MIFQNDLLFFVKKQSVKILWQHDDNVLFTMTIFVYIKLHKFKDSTLRLTLFCLSLL